MDTSKSNVTLAEEEHDLMDGAEEYLEINPKESKERNSEEIGSNRRTRQVSTLCWVLWGIVCAWCLFFTLYIILTFLAQPVYKWTTVSDYSPKKRAVPIAVHWSAGIIVMVIGPFQLLPQIRGKNTAIHRWMGRIYLLAVLIVCIAGLTYISLNGTVGGPSMDASFYINGVLFLVCGWFTYYYVKQKRMQLHREWAIRSFAMGVSSAFYRILISPLFIAGIIGDDGWISDQLAYIWLSTAAWLFYFPNLLVCEIYFYYKWKRGLLSYIVKYF